MSLQNAAFETGHSASPEVDRGRDHCGVWAMWDPSNPAILQNAFVGLQGIQHRGEEGAGVASISLDTPGIQYVRGKGTVTEVLGTKGEALASLPDASYAAIGHTWYGTDSGEGDSVQPRVESLLALAHNGQFTNKDELSVEFEITDYSSDSDLVTKIINQVAVRLNGDVERAVVQVLPKLRGAFCLTILTADKLIAARDRHGVRPLQLGTTETGGYVMASEWLAIDSIEGANWQREIEPAEMVVVDKYGERHGQWAQADPAVCVFEYAYLSNKTNIINGQRVADVRHQFGQRLAPYIPLGMTAIVPIPNSGIQSAKGLSEATGVPYVPAFQKKRSGRAFMQPNDEARIQLAKSKLELDPRHPIVGEDVLAVDDTLVRGHSGGVYMGQLKDSGANSVHLAIAAPQYNNTCELGVDTAEREELMSVRHGGDTEKMRRELGVASLTFLPRAEVRAVLGDKVCDFCIGGTKPNLISDIKERFDTLTGRLALTDVTASEVAAGS